MRNPVTSLANIGVKPVDSIFLLLPPRGHQFQPPPTFEAGFKTLKGICDADNFGIIHNRDEMTLPTSLSPESFPKKSSLQKRENFAPHSGHNPVNCKSFILQKKN